MARRKRMTDPKRQAMTMMAIMLEGNIVVMRKE